MREKPVFQGRLRNQYIYIYKSRVHGFQLCLLRSTGQDLLFGVTVYGRDFSRHVRIWLEDLRTPGDGSWNIQKNTGAVSVSFVKDSPPSVAPALCQQSFPFFLVQMAMFFFDLNDFDFLCKKSAKRSLVFCCLPFFLPYASQEVAHGTSSSLKTPFLWGERWRGKDDHWWIEAVQIPSHFGGCYQVSKDRPNQKMDRSVQIDHMMFIVFFGWRWCHSEEQW